MISLLLSVGTQGLSHPSLYVKGIMKPKTEARDSVKCQTMSASRLDISATADPASDLKRRHLEEGIRWCIRSSVALLQDMQLLLGGQGVVGA